MQLHDSVRAIAMNVNFLCTLYHVNQQNTPPFLLIHHFIPHNQISGHAPVRGKTEVFRYKMGVTQTTGPAILSA